MFSGCFMGKPLAEERIINRKLESGLVGMRAFAVLITLFLVSAAFAAGDTGPDSMRSFCLILLNLSGQASAQNQTALQQQPAATANFSHGAQYSEALAGLADANASIERMRGAGLPTLRATDTYSLALQWFEGQSLLESSGGAADFGFTLEKVREIKQIEISSFATDDDLRALSARLNATAPDVNVTKALELRNSALAEFSDGRFEEAQTFIDSAYQEISTAETDAARSKTLVESARKNVETFLRDNWQIILAVIAAVAVLAFVFQKRIRRFSVASRINSLMAERTVLESMMRGLQKDYFDRGKISEMTYHIRTKKFADLVRNINRQLPLLKEELKRI